MFRISNFSKIISDKDDNKMVKLLMRGNSTTEFPGRQALVSRYSSFVILGLIVLFIIVAYIQHLYVKYETRVRSRRRKRHKLILKECS
ncbi:Uncharacterized protein BM_BM13618 [Brugia malayi]|uniref:Uncharacterized protein n=2 Tax=Brugia malayi TaxID=6279 RepID=A0A5K1VQI7_BRUMA|nr:Uncharacterized protein BM_BM13618 [Brugia malayi]VIO99757.1 Uncharacterized protein BM_BM13618 [Brugia malayi]